MAAKIRGRIATNPESRTDGADPVVTGAKFVDAEADAAKAEAEVDADVAEDVETVDEAIDDDLAEAETA